MLEIVITHVNLRAAVCMATYFVTCGVRVVIYPVAIENVIENRRFILALKIKCTTSTSTIPWAQGFVIYKCIVNKDCWIGIAVSLIAPIFPYINPYGTTISIIISTAASPSPVTCLSAITFKQRVLNKNICIVISKIYGTATCLAAIIPTGGIHLVVTKLGITNNETIIISLRINGTTLIRTTFAIHCNIVWIKGAAFKNRFSVVTQINGTPHLLVFIICILYIITNKYGTLEVDGFSRIHVTQINGTTLPVCSIIFECYISKIGRPAFDTSNCTTSIPIICSGPFGRVGFKDHILE